LSRAPLSVTPVIRAHHDTAREKSLGPINAGSGYFGLATVLTSGK
jgi:hypothetical protein